MDTVQVLLFIVVIILTILLVAVGVQVFLILRGAQKTLNKLDNVLDDAGLISKSISRPVAGITSLIENIKGIKRLIEYVSGGSASQETSDTPEEVKVENVPKHIYTPSKDGQTGSHIRAIQERGRRFFHKGGKPLTS